MGGREDNTKEATETGTAETWLNPFEACMKAAGGALAENAERALRSDLAIYRRHRKVAVKLRRRRVDGSTKIRGVKAAVIDG